jgi:putative ABC transport system permease protein
MLRHITRLMWNKKRVHTLLIIEILASFLVLFGVTSLIVYNLRNYAQPLGFAYENVWVLNFGWRGQPDSTAADLMQSVKARVAAYPQVEGVTLFGGNSPYAMNTSNNHVEYNKRAVLAHTFTTDRDMANVLQVPVVEGRWFNKADEVDGLHTVVINQPMKEALFGDEPALGKMLEGKRKVVGVIGNFKADGEYQESEAGFFQLGTGDRRTSTRNLLVKVKPGTDANFEAQLIKDMGVMAKDWSIEVSYMEEQRKSRHKMVLIPVYIFLTVSGFLLINVALGLFGILNLNIARRRGEIGLRRALGATAVGISRQFVGEMWVLATFGLLAGLLFAVQFPLMNVFDLDSGIYVTAMVISTLAIYLIVTACALYPSRQAATIHPSAALHEE